MLVPKVPLCFMGCRLLLVSYPFPPPPPKLSCLSALCSTDLSLSQPVARI